MRNWIMLLGMLSLLACGQVGERPAPISPELLIGQPVSRTAERAPPFARRVAQSGGVGLSGGVTGFIIGRVVTQSLNADERARSRIGDVPTPQNVDPGLIIESMIADHLVARFGARPNMRDFYAGSVRDTASIERAPKVAELARRRGLSGVVVDVVALEYYADSTGRNLGLVNEKFRIVISAVMSLVDVETGEVIASGRCEGSHENVAEISAAEEDGPRLTTLLAQKAAASCAQQLIARMQR